jgi:hypothetical protein
MSREPLNPNPIVALAAKIRAQRDLASAVESVVPATVPPQDKDVSASLAAFGAALQTGSKRLNAILGKNGITFVRLENPLRIRLRFREKRVSLDADEQQQLVSLKGLGLEGLYQFDTNADTPALINLSQLSTETGYGEALTPSSLLKLIARDAELPRPSHLDAPGPLQL